MTGASAVHIARDCSISSAQRASSARIPTRHLSTKIREALESRAMDCKSVWAITGIITFSSKYPPWPPMVMQASLPITWAATWMTASGMTGLTLPGMMGECGAVPFDPHDAKPPLPGIAAEFLSQPNGGRILQMRPANLDHPVKLPRLGEEDLVQLPQGRQECPLA